MQRRALAAGHLGALDADAATAAAMLDRYLVAAWDSPEEFRPGRPMPRTGYVPFGAGPRLCIGRGMSLVEAPIILDHLRERYRFTVVKPVRMKPEVTIRPVGGMPLRVSRA